MNSQRLSRPLWSAGLLAVTLLYASYAMYEIRLGNWFWAWTVVDIGVPQPDEGLAFVWPTGRPYLSSRGRRSPAIVLEDGRPLLPAVGIEQVRKAEPGHFVFWDGLAYFSPSDGTNPADSGHTYAFTYPPVTRAESLALYAATAIAGLVTAVLLLMWFWKGGRLQKLGPAALTAAGETLTRWSSPIVLASRRPDSLFRPLVFALMTATLVAIGILALVDPVPTFAGLGRIFGWIGFALCATMAGVLGAEIVAGRLARSVGAARVVALLLLAFFVWVKAGYNGWPAAIDLLELMSPFIVMGLAGPRWVPGLSSWLEARLGARRLRVENAVIVAAVTVAATMAAHSIAVNWDVSGWMDSHSYEVAAANIANGKVLSGASEYMPVYQFGMAALYWVWGHFFFVQQIANLILLLMAVAALGRAAWLLFESPAAVAVAVVCVVFAPEFYYAVHFTQIESWYVPVICVLWLAWAQYWRVPTVRHLVLLALCIALGLNIRNQGAIFFGFICLTPLFAPSLPMKARAVHVVACGAVVALSLVPWTVRNYVVEGRWSPASSRSTIYIGVLNDRRVGLYGIRYWEGWQEVVDEYVARYPNARDRERALIATGWRLAISDPAWTARALYYRSLGFYGLLPDGLFQMPAMQATNWATEWPSYAFWRMTPLTFLPLSLLGLCFAYSRTQAFLAATVAAALSIMLVSATSEPRLSYPVLPSHVLLIAGLFRRRPDAVAAVARPHPTSPTALIGRRAMVSTIAAALIVAVGRMRLGSRFTYRQLIESGVTIDPALQLGTDSLSIADRFPVSAGSAGAWKDLVGRRVTLRCMVSNNMYPPKFAGRLAGFPPFATDPNRETYYYAHVLDERNTGIVGLVAVSFHGAVFNRTIREGDAVEIEGDVLAAQVPGVLWVKVIRARALAVLASQLPAYR